MKKAIILCMVGVICLFVMCGCNESNNSKSNNKSSKIADFSGTWTQVNSRSKDAYQEATISGDTIEIYWMSDGGETKSLYWAGTYVAPEGEVETYSWDSVNDQEKTKLALLTSSDDTKTISYKDGQIYYEASVMGASSTIKLEK